MGFPVEQIFRDAAGAVVSKSTVQDEFMATVVRQSPRSWNLCDDGLGLYSRTKKGIGKETATIRSREFRFLTIDDVDEALLEFDLLALIPQTAV